MSDWFLLVLMSLSAYRLTRLVVTDTFPPVLWLRDRLAGGWRPLSQAEVDINPWPKNWSVDDTGDEPIRYVQRAGWSPQWLADLLSCTWCASGWVSLGVVGGTSFFIEVMVPALYWFAVWGVASVLAAQPWA